MKRLLFVVHTLQAGGAERVLINLLKNLDKNKYSITVLAIVNDGPYIKELKEIENVEYKYVFNSFFKNSRYNTKSIFCKLSRKIMNLIWKIYLLLLKYCSGMLYKKAVKEKYDIEIAFLEGKVSKFVANSNNPKSKKIAWIHTDINNVSGINSFKNLEEEKNCYRKFDKIVCVSEEIKKRFSNKTGIYNNIYVQVNPIDYEKILKKSNEEIYKDLNYNGLVVCSVGRLVKEKGYDRLLEIHKRLINEQIIHTLWIIGDGEEKEKLKEYIKANNLEETVNLVGYTKNPYKYVKKADIFVCSSRIEGLSSALIEATALEKVIITTDCPGNKEIFGEELQTAMIVENNTEALYEGLKEILTNSSLRNKLSKNIKKRSNIFNIDNAVIEIEKILDDWGIYDGYRDKLSDRVG